MINLVNIPSQIIDTGKFNNLIFGKEVALLEEKIAEYTGAKYAVALNSATSAIFLSLQKEIIGGKQVVTLPSLSTTRFMCAIHHAGCQWKFTDDIKWVGSEYTLYKCDDFSIIDSAQRLDPNQYFEYKPTDLLIFSFYPTKPLGGCCGGMVVSNDQDKIEWIRQASKFGETMHSKNSWEANTGFIGWQKFMTTIQAEMVLNNFENYETKREKLREIAGKYSGAFGDHVVTSKSYHLYRVMVNCDNTFAVNELYKEGVVCGIHYKPAHIYPNYNLYPNYITANMLSSEYHGKYVISIPFHDQLSEGDIDIVINKVSKYI